MTPRPPENQAEGAPLELATARHAETFVRARGVLFLVTTHDGNITPAGARELGLFDRDTRFLSHYELFVVGVDVAYLSGEAAGDTFNQVDLMLSSGEDQEFLDDPRNYVHIRRRQLLDQAFVEELTFTSYLRRPLSFEVYLRFAADFADIFEVRGARRQRRGTMRVPRVSADEVELAYDGLDEVEYATNVVFRPGPSQLLAGEARFDVNLGPGERRAIEVVVRPIRRNGLPDGAAAPGPAFDERRAYLAKESVAFREACTRFSCDNGPLQQCLKRSKADLFALRTRVGGHAIITAGIPWFCCPFGRDALLASYEALLLNPELARASLRVLAAYQGRSDVVYTEEEPGKIMHELRFGEMTRTRETPHTPYYGTVDATPLFVVVAHATYEVTADRELVRELAPNLIAALAWIDRQTGDGRHFLSYQRRSPNGLDNQAWKDSRDGVIFPDGTLPRPPIAICEVQGYCADAYARGAQLMVVLGETELAVRYEARARAMRELIERELWLDEERRYAYAIDGEGRKVDTVVSNLGHLLWSRVATESHAHDIAELLLRPESFSGYGVRTLAAGQAAFNPLSYHNGTVWPHDNAIIAQGLAFYGRREACVRIFEGLVEALFTFRDRRLPELFCGIDSSSGVLVRYPVACSPQAWSAAVPFLLLQATLGIQANAPAGRLIVRDPMMPPSLREVRIENLRVGAARVSLRFRRDGRRCHVDVLDVSGSLRTMIEL